MVNHCTIIGRLGRDPRLSKIGGGVSVANFPVAVDSSRRGAAEKKELVWFDVSVFGNQAAENVAQQFKKGDLVYCAGPVSLHSYTAQGSSEKRTTLRLNATDARILSSQNRETAASDQLAQQEFRGTDTDPF